MNKATPPKIPIKFFQWFCRGPLQESILGDLEEQFESDTKKVSVRRAKWKFGWNVIRFFRPGIIGSSKRSLQLNQIDMFQNYFKIALRNLLRYRLFSFINIFGLSIGLATSLLIMAHLRNELSYENDFPKHENIYRVASTDWAKMPPVLAGQLKDEMPEIKEIGRLYFMFSRVMKYEDNQIMIEKPYLADPSILSIFDLKFIEGSANGALDDPSDIVLTEKMAQKFFKSGETRLGHVIEMVGQKNYTVSGIVEDLPQNSHLKIDCFMPLDGTWVNDNHSVGWSAVSTYALFDSQQDAQKMADKLSEFQVRFKEGKYTREEIIENGDFYELHPIDEIHLHSHREKETEANSNMVYIYILSAFAVFILLVVIINFINLYVAQALNRLKEVGIRKVIGAMRSQLVMQFLSEAFFLVLISTVLALVLVYLSLPYYNDLSNIKMDIGVLLSPDNLLLLLGLAVLIGLLAGGYPSLYLSKFGINQGLKTGDQKISHRLPLRTGMVAFQFMIAVFLITCTVIVSRQMDFIQAKDLGFAREEVVGFKLHGNLWDQATSNTEKLRNELTKHADVKYVSLSSKLIGDRFGFEPFSIDGNPDNEFQPRYLRADEWFAETMGIELVEGKTTKGLKGTHYILNESAANKLQEQNLIGKNGKNDFGRTEGKVTGIIKDFHFTSLHNEIEPLVIEIPEDIRYAGDYLLIRINTDDIKATMTDITTTLNEIAPNTPLVYHFLEEQLDNMYRSENDLFAVFKVFATIIISLACLGLFALFAFISQTRTKELGIRKTLGASLLQLLLILSKSYLNVLIIATLLVIPISSFFTTEWLANFAFRIETYWWHFTLPGLFVLCLAALSIVMQSWKVVNANPIDSLRDE